VTEGKKRGKKTTPRDRIDAIIKITHACRPSFFFSTFFISPFRFFSLRLSQDDEEKTRVSIKKRRKGRKNNRVFFSSFSFFFSFKLKEK
jgi:hypothetical protein